MKTKITVTEALQEIKTIDSRINNKKAFILGFLSRQNIQRDPHEKDGGSAFLLSKERQAINDLLERKVIIRRSINAANTINSITVKNQTRTIADWIVWKRDVAPIIKTMLDEITQQLKKTRSEAVHKGLHVTNSPSPEVNLDVVVNINEAELTKQVEELGDILSTLDGQLSLKNATITVEL